MSRRILHCLGFFIQLGLLLCLGWNCLSVSVFPITATCVTVVDMEWMLTCIACSALPGLVVISLYAFGFAREHTLMIGSDIRPWWIYHHYFAMAMALISLTWEIETESNCAQKQKGVQLFLQWAIMQGVAMLLQNRYQRQRLYTRIAMGKVQLSK